MALEGLDDMIAALNPDALTERIRAAATQAVREIAQAQYAAGEGPDGHAWPLTQDGSIPLQGPTSEIVFSETSTGIEATGPDVLQYHVGRRPVFPAEGTLSQQWAQAADDAATKALEETFSGIG